MAATKTKTIKRTDDTEETIKQISGEDIKAVARERAIEKSEDAAMSPKRIDPAQVSDLNQFNTSGLYHMNWPVHEFQSHFKDPVDHTVNFFYPSYRLPNTKDGKIVMDPTYIDVVRTMPELEKARKKAEIMKGLKRTYYIYRPDQTNPLQQAIEAEESDEGDDE